MKGLTIIILSVLFLSYTFCPSLADDEELGDNSSEIEEELALEDDEEGTPEKIPLTEKPININIQPVPVEEFSCVGIPDGVQVHPDPKDCIGFYICIKESGHIVHCPKIPQQTYFNPIKKLCDNSAPDYCKKYQKDLEEEENEGSKEEDVDFESMEDDDDEGDNSWTVESDEADDDQDQEDEENLRHSEKVEL